MDWGVLAQLAFTLRGFAAYPSREGRRLLLGIFLPILINSFTEFGIFGMSNYGILLYQLLMLPLNAAVFTPWLGPAGWLLGYALYWVLLLGASLLLYIYVEQPFMRLREGRAASAVAGPAARLVPARQ